MPTDRDAGDAPLRAVGDAVLAEQLAYYRARAPEYDRWFNREGRYDRGEASTAAWLAELDVVRAALAATIVSGSRVVELAAGTGLWTRELLALGAQVTVIDAAPEMLAELRARVGDTVDVVVADLFSWTPAERFDATVSCFFMSHVPDERFDAFAATVASALRPGGSVFLLDGLAEPSSTADDHELPLSGDQTMRRRLDDGREFTIVKRFRGDAELAGAFEPHGIDLDVRRSSTYFQFAVGTRRP